MNDIRYIPLEIHVGYKQADGSIEYVPASGCVYKKTDGTCAADGTACTYPNCDGHQPVSETAEEEPC